MLVMKLIARYLFVFTFVSLLFFLPVQAQNEVQLELRLEQEEVAVGQRFDAIVHASIGEGWHLYSMDVPPGGPIPTTIGVVDGDIFEGAGPPLQPEPIPWFDENFGMETSYFEDSVDFTVPVRVRNGAGPGNHELAVQVRYMICNDTTCLPPQTRSVSTYLSVVPGSSAGSSTETAVETGEPAGSSQEESSAAVATGPETRGGATSAPAAATTQSSAPGENSTGESSGLPVGTLTYLWFAMTMGGLALLTPCVFPMIPITVSYFTKRDADNRSRAVFEAGLYSVGIILTFTLLGFILTFLFGAGGINRLAASPIVNLAIAAIFVFFALSLFGVLEIGLPNSWLNAVNRKSSGSSGITGILLMSLTFSLTSFTCTVPFVGTVMVAALQGDVLWSLLGVTAFATVFSLPFFLLALFPSWLQALPKSGNWMNSVKITMGFLELAAALKFISNVDLVYQWEFITRPVFITVWLALALVTTGYLLGWFRFPHETASGSIGAFRVLFATFFLAVSFYLLRGLFGFPLGELDAFLPPRGYGEAQVASFMQRPGGEEERRWLADYDAALERAQIENKPVFIDFTGYTCTNCRWMEANMFPLPEVQAMFSEFVLVRLYTDGTEPEHAANQQLERKRFGTIALPFYAIISPHEETLATFPGLTRDRNEFLDFLREGVMGYSRLAQVEPARN